MLLLPVAAASTAPAIAPGPHAGGSFSVAISYTPSPADPLLLTFSATVVPGTPTSFHWAFGDGQYANGTTSAYAAPVHRYSAPGSYNVSVLVFEGNISASQFLPLVLSASALVASFTLTAESGTAPFLDTFTATVRGGSGTYPSVLWQFGDGGVGSGLIIRYTYEHAGNYVVVLNVTDSDGHSTVARTNVSVSAPASTTPSLTSNGALALLAVAVAAIGGTIVGALVVGRWLGRREPSEPPSAPPAGSTPSAEVALPPPATPSPSLPSAGPPPEPAAAVPSTAVEETDAPPSVRVASPEIPAPAPASSPAPEALRVSQRIVLHLAGLGVLGADEVAAVGFTQLGMSQALGTRQNALTNVLRRLVAAGVLTEDVRHVRGQPRRLKVYRLTSRGEALARELRATRPRTPRGGAL